MTRDSEKAIASLQKYIDSLGDDIQSEEDLNDVLQEFMQKYNAGLNGTHRDPDIYDLEDMADRAPTKKEKLRELRNRVERKKELYYNAVNAFEHQPWF